MRIVFVVKEILYFLSQIAFSHFFLKEHLCTSGSVWGLSPPMRACLTNHSTSKTYSHGRELGTLGFKCTLNGIKQVYRQITRKYINAHTKKRKKKRCPRKKRYFAITAKEHILCEGTQFFFSSMSPSWVRTNSSATAI